MAYSIKDVENGVKKFNQKTEQRADARAQEVADYIASSTAQGRGLWVLILWPVWFFCFASLSYILIWAL